VLGLNKTHTAVADRSGDGPGVLVFTSVLTALNEVYGKTVDLELA
jgi:hypothetical protein